MNDLWYLSTPSKTLQALDSSERGLNEKEAAKRLQEYGPNKLPEAKTENLAVIFIRQFKSPLIYILIASSAIVLAMGEVVDGIMIIFVLLFNAVLGTVQEGRAQNTLLSLKNFVKTTAIVLREGKELVISDGEVVPGDILIIQEGDKIPADARVILANNLKVDEAALTGESEPVHKKADAMENQHALPVAEQRNMLFKGTHIVAGNGKAVAVATGVNTAIGKISKEITAIDTEIPLKADIRYLSKAIIITVLTISAFLFISGIALGKSAKEMFATVVALSVSIIPEGLPIVITLVLATGVWRMSKHHALVKRLQAVEALGQARVILVDKTGTITKNEMVVQKVYVNGKLFEVKGVGYEPLGDIWLKEKNIDPLNHPELLFLGKIASFCVNARIVFLEKDQQWKVFGDPTEAALSVFAQKIGFHKESLEEEFPRVAELPFDYKIKYHATVHKVDGKKVLAVAGAPEDILSLSSNIWSSHNSNSSVVGVRQMSTSEKEKLKEVFADFSEQGLRVVAISVSYDVPDTLAPENIKNLTFLGFVGMKDALRPEVHEALKRSRLAGIRVVMITGDHKKTAQAIAKEAGIFTEGDEILTGEDIDQISDKALSEKLARVSVFARVTPMHKLRIVKAYKIKKEIIAMTGDGVNDALSLVAADLGVAMGSIGTEVAKEASDIVLLDDNFGSIVWAVEEGRSIYKTIKKVILYLFSTGVGEALTIGAALFLGYPLPILPSQIIWLNFVTDGFLDVALAMEPKEKGLLAGNFERPKKYLVDKLMASRIFLMALPMMIGTLFLFERYFQVDMVKAWTISLTTLAVFQWFNAWNCRHESSSIFKMNPFSNKFLVGSTILIIFLHLLVIYNPLMQGLFTTTSLTLAEWLLIIPVAASIIMVEEIRKFFFRRKLARGTSQQKPIVNPFLNVNIIIKKVAGVLLIIIGLIALATPFTPGSWLIFVGLGLLGLRILYSDRIKDWFNNFFRK